MPKIAGALGERVGAAEDIQRREGLKEREMACGRLVHPGEGAAHDLWPKPRADGEVRLALACASVFDVHRELGKSGKGVGGVDGLARRDHPS